MISSHGRRVKICVCCPVISTPLSSAVLGWGLGLCASVEVCVQISLCWCWRQSEGGLQLFLHDRCWSVLRVGSAPRGRRFRCCRRFLWPSSVALTPLASLPSIFSWLPAAACPRPSPRSCPSPSKAWALTTSLARMMEAACCRPEDKTKKV